MIGFGGALSCIVVEEPGTTTADSGAEPTDPALREATVLALDPDLANGEVLYADTCAVCHATDGSGGIGSNLWDSDVPVFVDALLFGRTGMPRYDDRFDNQQIADLAHHGASLDPP
ncbi:MAG: c-type cytochrome [Myxococcota bacterium]